MLSIRQYKPSDKRELMNLHKVALEKTDAYITIKNYYKDLEDIEGIYFDNNGEFLVGFFENRLVTMGGLHKISNDRVEIKRMRTHPDYQRKGLGQMMLNRLEKRARELGYKKIQLNTMINQVAAIHFYLKNGYKEFRRETEGWALETIFYEKIL